MAIVTLDAIKAKQKNKPDKNKKTEVSSEEKTNYQAIFQNDSQTNKKTADRQQLDSKRTAIDQQKESKKEAKKTADRQQLDSKGARRNKPLDSHYPADWTADKTADRQQLDSKRTAKIDISCLTGKESHLVQIIFDNCQNSGSLETSNLATDQLRKSLGITTKRLGNLVERLRKKEIIEVTFSKRGNGGFRRFKLFQDHYQKLILNQKDSRSTAIRQQKDSNYPPDWTADKTASPSSSSSVQKNNSTTTSDELWKTLNLSHVESLGINESAIFEARQKFGPFSFVDFEKFLERFSKFMLDNKKSKGIGNARGFFFSLCKQIGEGIEPLSEIKTDSDEALEKLLKEKREAKKRREELQRELMEFEFYEWFEALSQMEKDKIQPQSDLLKQGSEPYKAIFRSYFEENLWLEKKQKMIEGKL